MPSCCGRRTPSTFAFGIGSRAAHRSAAERAGVPYIEVGGRLSIDLDTPDDLVLVESMAPEVPLAG